MRKIIIMYVRYYDMDGKTKTIGGIQTYITNLVKVCSKHGYEPIVLQPSNKSFIKNEEYCKVIGIPCNYKKYSVISRELTKFAESISNDKDILIFGSSVLCRKTKRTNVVSIQHGIYWDVLDVKGISKIPSVVSTFLRFIQALIELKKQKNANIIVCVDYNYINWYRSQTIKRNIKLFPILNFVETREYKREGLSNENISIVFARRFEKIRGTSLLANVMPRILDEYTNVRLTIAGTGSDEEYLKKVFYKYNNQVKFTSYASDDSIDFHSKFDIALIPSIGSEGTSLSLLEAMWAGCAIIATNIGGMTNILIDKYNGLMINPDEKEFYDALKTLILNKQFREKIVSNAQNTVLQAFNKDIWEQRWIKVLEEVSE